MGEKNEEKEAVGEVRDGNADEFATCRGVLVHYNCDIRDESVQRIVGVTLTRDGGKKKDFGLTPESKKISNKYITRYTHAISPPKDNYGLCSITCFLGDKSEVIGVQCGFTFT